MLGVPLEPEDPSPAPWPPPPLPPPLLCPPPPLLSSGSRYDLSVLLEDCKVMIGSVVSRDRRLLVKVGIDLVDEEVWRVSDDDMDGTSELVISAAKATNKSQIGRRAFIVCSS